jgi:hypothetical protein
MAVAARSNDPSGSAIDTKISALNTAVSAAGDAQSKAALQTALAASQTEAVIHYVNNGRIAAADVLTGLSVSAASLPQFTAAQKAALGSAGVNISARITALTSDAAIAGPTQATAQRLLLEAQKELVYLLLHAGTITAASVLSTLS